MDQAIGKSLSLSDVSETDAMRKEEGAGNCFQACGLGVTTCHTKKNSRPDFKKKKGVQRYNMHKPYRTAHKKVRPGKSIARSEHPGRGPLLEKIGYMSKKKEKKGGNRGEMWTWVIAIPF